MSIQIISLKETAQKQYKKKCKCGCKFSYTNDDVTHDFRDGDWFIQCPHCKSELLHKREWFKSKYTDRANDC